MQTLVATPTISLLRVQAASPSSVRDRTFNRPRRWSLTISVPSMLISGVALPILRSSFATSSVISWPFVKIWK